MLTDEQFEKIGDAAARVFQALEKGIISSLASGMRRLAAFLTSAQERIAALRSGGAGTARIRRDVRRTLAADKAYKAALAKETGAFGREAAKETKDALREAQSVAADLLPLAETQAHDAVEEARRQAESAERSAPPPEPPVSAGNDATPPASEPPAGESAEPPPDADAPAQAAVEAAGKELAHIARSSAFRVGGVDTPATRVFQRAVDDALERMLSGELSIDEALRRTVGELAAQGMRTVTYAESGRKIVTHTDVAVRRCLQTAAARASGEQIMSDCKRLGVNHVEVSAHWGARTDGSGGHADHQAWQGKVYQIDGSAEGYPNLEAATGYPGDMLGLLGYNCRHSMSPFWPGISTPNEWPEEPGPKEYRGKAYTYYEAAQRMRRYEREIRAEKRRDYAEKALGGAGVPKSRIEGMKDAYRDFCKAMKMRPAWNRTIVDGEGPDFKRIFEKQRSGESHDRPERS